MPSDLPPMLAAHSEKIDAFMAVSIKAMDAFGQLMELNVATAKASLEERQAAMRLMSGAKNSQELWTIQSGWMKPMPDKLSAYCRQCYAIFQSSNTEITQKLGSRSSQSQEAWAAFFDGLAKTAPVTSEAAAALAKSAVGMVNNAFESVQQAVLHNGHDLGAEQAAGQNSTSTRGKTSRMQSPGSRG